MSEEAALAENIRTEILANIQFAKLRMTALLSMLSDEEFNAREPHFKAADDALQAALRALILPACWPKVDEKLFEHKIAKLAGRPNFGKL